MTAGLVADQSETAARQGTAPRRWPLKLGFLAQLKSLGGRRESSLRRYGLHLALAGVVSAVALVPAVSAPTARLPLAQAWVNVAAGRSLVDDGMPSARGQHGEMPVGEERLLERGALPRTAQAQYPQWLPIAYTVQTGDTLSTLSQRFGLDERTVVWANESLVQHPDQLSLGQELVILPINAAYHTVAEGETLESIAAKYQVLPQTILAYKGNGVTSAGQLQPGAKVIVPGAVLPEVPKPTPVPRAVEEPASAASDNEGETYTASASESAGGTGSLGWPLSGMITQRYGGYHEGIDIHTPAGRPVVAADAGTVVLVSWMRYSYGYHIIIDHGNGLETLYAHLSEIEVEVGQVVSKGEEVGKVGSTGRSTGPHLHFEVRENGGHRNPFSYLP